MKKDAEWVTVVTPKEVELTDWQGKLLAMKIGEWCRTNATGRMTSVQYAAWKLKKDSKGAWRSRTSTDGKWRWIQRVK